MTDHGTLRRRYYRDGARRGIRRADGKKPEPEHPAAGQHADGMGGFGMVALETQNSQYLGQDTSLTCSPAFAEKIDEQVVALVEEARKKADSILREHEDKLHELAAYLLNKETITGEEFMSILKADDQKP